MNRDKRVANSLLLAYGILSLIFLCLPMSVPVQSIRACVAYVVNPTPFYGDRAMERFIGMPQAIARLISADVENRRLRQDLQRMPFLESENESLKRENERLKVSMGLKPEQGKVLRWAKIVERDPQNWYRYIIVDAGKSD
jgi:cell shape-determining protein MreC